jgi:hypothetical protein
MTLTLNAARAEVCATNVSELRQLVGNSSVPLRWRETSEKNASRVLTLTLGDGGAAGMSLVLRLSDGTLWAEFKGKICKSGSANLLYAVVNKPASSFGPGAPSIVKLVGKPSKIDLDLTYHSQLRVKVSSYRGTYEAL